MKTLFDKVRNARLGGRVERCHSLPHHGSYSNASHTWGCLLLLWYLWPEDFARIAPAVLGHDVPEAWVGDLPGPTMRTVPGLREQLGKVEDDILDALGLPRPGDLSPEDHAKLKAVDHLDFYIWAREQVAMGNQFAKEGLLDMEEHFTTTPLPSPADELFALYESGSALGQQAGVMRKMIGEHDEE